MIQTIEFKDLTEIETIGKATLPIYYEQSDLYFLLFDKNYLMYKITENEEIVGFIIVKKKDNKIHVMSLAIKESYQRKGYATQLIQHLKELKCILISLYVLEDNEAAIQLYEKNGFHQIALIEQYYESLNKNAYLYEYHKI